MLDICLPSAVIFSLCMANPVCGLQTTVAYLAYLGYAKAGCWPNACEMTFKTG